jgi:prepilin-type N-terminal cleavage/methylation domain-containing protein
MERELAVYKLMHKRQNGDTIVEVLISVAIITLVLAIAYATMTRNITIMQDNQERSQAAKVTQGQVEALKQAWSTDAGRASIIARRGAAFCMDMDVAVPASSAACTNGINRSAITYSSVTEVYTVAGIG